MGQTSDNQGKSGGGGYLEPYRVYASQYGVQLRGVKRWVATGRENADPCPLDQPREMVGWWSRNMKQRVPTRIFEAAGPDAMVDLPMVVEKAPAAPSAPAPAPPIDSTPPEDVEMPEGRGLEAELGRLENLAARLSIRSHEPGQAKAYLDTVARMGTLSAKLREEAERMKRLLPRDAVESAIHEFHGPIEREVRLLFRTMCETLGFPASPEKEDAWNKEIDKLFIRFREEVLSV